MMKHEFEALADTEVSHEEYEVIETVYMYYPGIEKKEQIISMHKIGMHLIADCHERAKELKDIESKIANLNRRASELRI